MLSFKPYYNWNTFNTSSVSLLTYVQPPVLNLIITGIPSILEESGLSRQEIIVLNLIITGIPSIHDVIDRYCCRVSSFKPYYNWNTFNTMTNFIK